MAAIKDYYHDLIESKTRLYDILELQQMEHDQLIELAYGRNITVAQASGKQTLIYAILDKQNEA